MEVDDMDVAVSEPERPARVSAGRGPLSVLLTSIRSVRAMRYAMAVAGLAATVALVTAFRLKYSVLIVGSLLIVGLMYVVLSFSRFAARRNKSSDVLNILLAWTFSGVVAAVAIFVTTAISFGWPRPLHQALLTSKLSGDEYWKIKVFDFVDYGELAERNRVGQRFSGMVLDEIMKSQINVLNSTGRDPISLVPMRGSYYEAADVSAYKTFLPAVVVSGYVSDGEAPGEYNFSVRVTAASGTALFPAAHADGLFMASDKSMRARASAVALDVVRVARQFGTR